MKIRRTLIAIATASLLVVPATTAVAGGNYDCRDDKRTFEYKHGGKKDKDYKYAPDKECDKDDKDRDHRDKDRDKDRDKEYSKDRDHKDYDKAEKPSSKPLVKKSSAPSKSRQTTYTGRVLKTN